MVVFDKFEGTGNDFVIIDNRDLSFNPDPDTVARLCHRRFGIGADGLILLQSYEEKDFEMVYFNSDGHLGSMCGNGGRCISAFAYMKGVAQEHCTFKAYDGDHEAFVQPVQGKTGVFHVKLSMNEVAGLQTIADDFFLDTGSPHYVSMRNNLGDMDVVEEGRKIRYSEPFRKSGTNVNFVHEEGEGIRVRTYERGVEDETLCCGTGVTASVLCYASIRGMDAGSVPVAVQGGNVTVHFAKNGDTFSNLWLEGQARHVFTGTWPLDL
ncbi:MAG: diaminopimelate epimerase [Flavobacteriales bacterium]|nr:diaminopimelate epimerase [Flavobacteriales bacterium]